MYSSTFLGNRQYLYLYLSIFQMYFDFQVLLEYIQVLLAFLSHYFPSTKLVTGVDGVDGVDGTGCSLASAVSSVATEWGPHKPTG